MLVKWNMLAAATAEAPAFTALLQSEGLEAPPATISGMRVRESYIVD